MSKFRKEGKRSTPAISTASLPDIVFMLLFFFMVTTVVKENDPQVLFEIPDTNYTKLIEDRQSIGFIYVGVPIDGTKGEGTQFEINGQVVNSTKELTTQIREKYSRLSPEEKAKYYFALKVDTDTKMSRLSIVKRALQQQEARKIIYSTNQKDK